MGRGRHGQRLGRAQLFGLGLIGPDIGGQRSLFRDEFLRAFGVVHHRGDLALVANDPGILQQPVGVRVGEGRDLVDLEILEEVEAVVEAAAAIDEAAPVDAGAEA